MIPHKHLARFRLSAALAAACALSGCLSGSTTGSSGVTLTGDVPIAYAKRATAITLNPLDAAPFAPGGDLMIRAMASPSASEYNITAAFTQGKGDVADPSVSYDGKKILFAMNCPASNTATIGGQPACTGHWNIWEYDTTNGLSSGTFRRITSSSTDDDVAPTYLPGGAGIVMTSNRQATSSVNQFMGHSYKALDEYERRTVFNLHTMDLNGQHIQQISFNQSHDRNPTIHVDPVTGVSIMFSRWDHVGDRNRFTIFTTRPDGTGMFVLFGAHNDGNSFLHPQDMDPNGPYKGYLSSDLMPLDRTQEGGALMLIDANRYSEQNTPANNTIPAIGGQQQATSQQLNYGLGVSLYGRVTTPYPLRDGSNRFLVAYAPCEVSRSGVVVSCATLTPAEIARLNNPNRLPADVAADPLQNNVPPVYAIYTYNPGNQTWLIVAAPPGGFLYKNPVPLMATQEPPAAQTAVVSAAVPQNCLAGYQNCGLIDVQSAYDTDGLGRMGDPVVAQSDTQSACSTVSSVIAKTTPPDPLDTRPLVADLVKIKDPAQSAYQCAPARFVRVVRAVAPPSGSTGTRQAIGNTNFEMQQILGYAPVQPDGSFKLAVPADTPIGLEVVDAEGRAFQVHTNWIQVRTGEVRTCDGCHSPRRGAAINSGPIANSVPAAWQTRWISGPNAHQTGDTMAATLTRAYPTQMILQPDPVYDDEWAGTSHGGIARPDIALLYTGNSSSSDDLTTLAPTNGIINYPDHIQPIWDLHCVSCHSASDTTLNLTSSVAGTGRYTSYESLTVGPPVINPATGLPVFLVDNGQLIVQRNPAVVVPTGSESDAVGIARKSRLTEILWGETLLVDSTSESLYPNPPVSHAGMLNKAEKRLVAEWMDLGAKYYNDPFASGSPISISTLSFAVFQSQIEPILMKTCAAYCHQAIGSNITTPPGTSFAGDRLVLTGEPNGDFNVVLTMIDKVSCPASNPLLKMPSTIPHPPQAVGQTTAVLPVGSADYNTIANWIQAGATQVSCP